MDDQSGLAQRGHHLTPSGELLHGQEERVWADDRYQGIRKREERKHRQVPWRMALGPSRRKALAKGEEQEVMEKRKASGQDRWSTSSSASKGLLDQGMASASPGGKRC